MHDVRGFVGRQRLGLLHLRCQHRLVGVGGVGVLRGALTQASTQEIDFDVEVEDDERHPETLRELAAPRRAVRA